MVLTGSLSLAVAQLEAWMLVASISNPSGTLVRLIPGTSDLLRSHLDYLMMAMLLYIFFGLFTHFKVAAHPVILLSMCIGSIGYPFLFLVRAMRPGLKGSNPPFFRVAMGISCILTTIGYLGVPILSLAPQPPQYSSVRRVASTTVLPKLGA